MSKVIAIFKLANVLIKAQMYLFLALFSNISSKFEDLEDHGFGFLWGHRILKFF
jgi:hypothetical protein